jgi:hypothetical protein
MRASCLTPVGLTLMSPSTHLNLILKTTNENSYDDEIDSDLENSTFETVQS